MKDKNRLLEALADWEHQTWAGWAQWMIDNWDEAHIQGWKRQIATPYAELPENEKESDRREARGVLNVIGSFISEAIND